MTGKEVFTTKTGATLDSEGAKKESKTSVNFAKSIIERVDDAHKHGHDGNVPLSVEREFQAALANASSTIAEQQTGHEMFLKRTLRSSRTSDKLSMAEKISLLLRNAEAYVSVRQKATDEFVQENKRVFLQVAEYADSKLGTSLVAFCEQVFGYAAPWKECSSIIVVLNDIYEQARSLQADQHLDSEWVAPSSFERSTTKYWVMNGKVNQVLLAALAETPLLVYGRKGPLVSDQECSRPFDREYGGDQLWDKHAAQISSVYFDSPNVDLYKARLARHEGSNLLRARWYGNKKPVGSEPIFLELKTHHEKWVNTKSVKERVTIRERDMASILDVEEAWTRDQAKKIALAGIPAMKAKELDKAIDLLVRIRDLVTRFRLRATVRTKYQRAAFQSPKSNALRLTLDLSVTLIDETKSQAGRQWCLSDKSIAAGKFHMKTVPYAVFEVKLSGREMPDGLRVLLQDKEAIVTAEKFSKYQTGAAAFNLKKVDALPYWAADPSFDALFELPTETDGSDRTTLSNTSQSTSSRSSSSNESDHTLSTTALSSSLYGPCSALPVEIFEEVPAVRKRSAKHNQKDSGRKRLWVSDFWFERSSSKQNPKKIAPKQRVRVEPKSYFANERTFIQWISAALLLFTVAVILFDMTIDHGFSHIAATCLICCGLFLACYALFTYYRRLRLLQSGNPYGYIDHIGPILITVSILLGLGIYLSEVALGSTTPVLHQDGVNCHRHALVGTGISPLAFEPSDLFYDDAHDRLLMVSHSQITSVDVSSGLVSQGQESAAEFVLDLGFGVDSEGLTMVDDVLYAVSERLGENSMLYAVRISDDDPLQVFGKWEMPMQDTEGITYIPDIDGGHGKLLIGSRDALEMFDVPHLAGFENLTEPLTALTNVFNGRVVGYGIDDTKIGALCFFEGVLYVLMDNSRVIRGWDLAKGLFLSQINLPTVGGGFDKQWEGMALRRVSASRQGTKPSLRNTRADDQKTVLVLDLALDTPGHVWSFVVEETGKPGQFKMPSCAATSYTNHNTTDFDTVAAFLNP